MKRRFGVVSLAGAALLACGGGAAPAKPSSAALPEGQVARAGAELVSSSSITRIVQSQSVAPAAAAAAAVSDALFAQSARERLAPGTARSIERAAIAKAMLEQLSDDARRAGPPTDAELAEMLEGVGAAREIEVEGRGCRDEAHLALLK